MALTFLSGTEEYIGKRKHHGGGGGHKKKKHRVAKIAMAPARTAFLEAVRFNVLKLATKLAKIHKAHPGELDNFWDKFGGDATKLKRAIEHGSKEKLGEPVTLAAGLATALPIVLKAVDMFKKFGLHNDSDEKATQDFTDKSQAQLEQDPAVPKAKATLPEGEKTGKIVNDPDVPATDDQGNEIKKPWYKNKKVLIPAGIATALIVGGLAYRHSHKTAQ